MLSKCWQKRMVYWQNCPNKYWHNKKRTEQDVTDIDYELYFVRYMLFIFTDFPTNA